ncbi:MAG: PGF-CTERM sorting domain-containing protein [Candidatus Syntropharchaeia archaeon]
MKKGFWRIAILTLVFGMLGLANATYQEKIAYDEDYGNSVWEMNPDDSKIIFASENRDFTILIEPRYVEVDAGDSIEYTVKIIPHGGFDDPIDLTLEISAPFYSTTYQLPTQYPPYEELKYTIKIPENVPSCTAKGKITATGGGITHTAIAEAKITPGFEAVFTIAGLFAMMYLLGRRR